MIERITTEDGRDAVRYGIQTTLTLFQYPEFMLEKNRDEYMKASDLVDNFTVILTAINRVSDESGVHTDKLTERLQSLNEDKRIIESSITTGAAYIKLHDELSRIGVTDSDILSLFVRFVKLNTNLTRLVQEGANYDANTLALFNLTHNPFGSQYNEILETQAGLAPSWFNGRNRNEWLNFVRVHSTFPSYLSRFSDEYPQFPRLVYPNIGLSSKDCYPDWLNEVDLKVPERIIVEQELVEDINESSMIDKQIIDIRRQYAYITSVMVDKIKKVLMRIETKRREYLGPLDNLARLVTYLAIVSNPNYTECKLEPQAIQTAGDLEAIIVNKLYSSENKFKEFIESERIFNKESLGLWIEEQLGISKIIKLASDPIDSRIFNLLEILFSSATDPGGTLSENLIKIRGEDKKVFEVLNYGLRPFLSMLSEDEIGYLKELSLDLQEQPIEPLIWEMAEFISGYKKDLFEKGRDQNPENRTLRINIKHFRDFTNTWIRRNWQACVFELRARLFGQEIITDLSEATPTELVTEAPEISEAEYEFNQSEQNHLVGWRLRYTENISFDDKYHIEIEGDTLAERTKFLDKYLREQNISCSIGAGSVINALNWVVTSPDEVEWIRIAKTIGQNRVKKLKRKGVRIFYLLDKKEMELVFFVHQKKAYGYGF